MLSVRADYKCKPYLCMTLRASGSVLRLTVHHEIFSISRWLKQLQCCLEVTATSGLSCNVPECEHNT